MAFNGNISVSQGLNVQSFTLTDTSTGSDPSLTGRTISLFQSDGDLLGGSVIQWPLSSGSTITLNDVLVPWDYSLNILVEWQSSSPIPGSVYSKSTLATFDGQSNEFAYSLVQQISSNQGITRNKDYLYNLALINSDILNAQRCNNFGDQGAAQECLNRIYNYYVNRSLYF
jgi:hypothetical protein